MMCTVHTSRLSAIPCPPACKPFFTEVEAHWGTEFSSVPYGHVFVLVTWCGRRVWPAGVRFGRLFFRHVNLIQIRDVWLQKKKNKKKPKISFGEDKMSWAGRARLWGKNGLEPTTCGVWGYPAGLPKLGWQNHRMEDWPNHFSTPLMQWIVRTVVPCIGT